MLGGGKSLVYQVPALCFGLLDKQQNVRQGRGEKGICLVVSPLISLMKDQVDALRRRGISAAVVDSTQSKEQYLQTVDAMRDGTLDILYCAPERLNNEGFVSSMVCPLCRQGWSAWISERQLVLVTPQIPANAETRLMSAEVCDS